MVETKIYAERINDTIEFEFSELALGDGTALLPSIAFQNDQDTGFWRSGPDTLNITTGGTNRWQIDAGGGLVSVNSSRIFAADGTAALPSISLLNDQDTGLYSVTADQLGLAAAGVLQLTVRNGEIVPAVTLRTAHSGSAATPSYSFTADEDTGFYRTGSPGFAGSVSGVVRLEQTETQLRLLGSDGTSAAPRLTIGGDDDTGIYRAGADILGFSAGGSGGQRLVKDGSDIQLQADTLGAVSSTTNPAYSFLSDTDSGLHYFSFVDTLSLIKDGTRILDVDNLSGLRVVWQNPVFYPDGTTAAPSFAFSSDTNTGLYRKSADVLGFVAGGEEVAAFTNAAEAWTFKSITSSNPRIVLFQDSAHAEGRGPGIQFRGQYDAVPNNAIFGGIFGVKQSGGAGLQEGNLLFTTNDGAGNNNQAMLIDANHNVRFNDGSTSTPSITFANDTDLGIYRNASNNISVTMATGGNFNIVEGGVQKLRYDGGADGWLPLADNDITLGNASLRYSDVRSVLINGSDYGFANGWILREYPCTAEDVQSKSNNWMKENANKGIQVINDEGETIIIFGRDGTIYAKDIRPLAEAPQ